MIFFIQLLLFFIAQAPEMESVDDISDHEIQDSSKNKNVEARVKSLQTVLTRSNVLPENFKRVTLDPSIEGIFRYTFGPSSKSPINYCAFRFDFLKHFFEKVYLKWIASTT